MSVCRLDVVRRLSRVAVKEEMRRLYLKTSDQVFHSRFPEWGPGVVVEERNSGVLGGMSYVRVAFSDGRTRVFDNNFANSYCCYYAGVRRYSGKRA